MCGVADNMCANMRIPSGESKHRIELSLTRTSYKRSISQVFRFYSFYIRSEQNVSADPPPRPNTMEISAWPVENGMTRMRPIDKRVRFSHENSIACVGYDIRHGVIIHRSSSEVVFRAFEWEPGGFCISQASKVLPLRCD